MAAVEIGDPRDTLGVRFAAAAVVARGRLPAVEA
jgi:hypothetical protein